MCWHLWWPVRPVIVSEVIRYVARHTAAFGGLVVVAGHQGGLPSNLCCGAISCIQSTRPGRRSRGVLLDELASVRSPF